MKNLPWLVPAASRPEWLQSEWEWTESYSCKKFKSPILINQAICLRYWTAMTTHLHSNGFIRCFSETLKAVGAVQMCSEILKFKSGPPRGLLLLSRFKYQSANWNSTQRAFHVAQLFCGVIIRVWNIFCSVLNTIKFPSVNEGMTITTKIAPQDYMSKMPWKQTPTLPTMMLLFSIYVAA